MRKLRILVSFAFVMIGVLTLSAQMLNPLTWNVRLESNGGSDAELVVEAKIERGWHLYDIKLPKDGPVPTSIVWDKDRLRNVEIVGDLTPNRKAEENVDMFFHLILGTWENSVTFHQKVRLVNPNDYNIEGAIVGQVCNDETCQRKKQEFKFFKESASVALQDTVPVTVLRPRSRVDWKCLRIGIQLLRQTPSRKEASQCFLFFWVDCLAVCWLC